jgi:ABC-type dipeptide/oligopeptide/nickel transport system permease component
MVDFRYIAARHGTFILGRDFEENFKMIRFLLQRLLSALPVVCGVVLLVFFLLHLVPGDPVELMLGDSARPADRTALRHALGLDQPLEQQLLQYVTALARLDLGTSLFSRQPVIGMLAERLPATLELAVAALALAMLLGIPLGMLAAYYHRRAADTAAMGFSLVGMSIPNFWLGPLLILLFSLWLGWTPVSGREGLDSLALPALTLGASLAAVLARMVRGSLLEVLGEDFIRTGRAKGLSAWAVLRRHALRNAWLPVLTLLGLQLGALLGGAVITETVFSWPGVGALLVQAIQQRDYPVVQGCVLLVSLIYVLVNTLTDLLYAWVDPRIRLGEN